MKELLKALSKPRSIYFSIIAMLTLTLCLMKISFSYYIPVSKDTDELNVNEIVNILTIEDYDSKEIAFEANETKELTFKVQSQNEIESSYVVFYVGDNFAIENLTTINSTNNPFEEKTFTIKVTNNLDQVNTIKFDIKSGFKNKTIDLNEGVNIIK